MTKENLNRIKDAILATRRLKEPQPVYMGSREAAQEAVQEMRKVLWQKPFLEMELELWVEKKAMVVGLKGPPRGAKAEQKRERRYQVLLDLGWEPEEELAWLRLAEK